jgi:broad specificity phosphatase PhoE
MESMIPKKEFYFIRHGQTDYNILRDEDKIDHPPHISINETGRKQAKAVEPLIAKLPVHIVCASPMKRAQETKEIVTARLQIPHHAIDDLGECTSRIWLEMNRHGMYSPLPKEGEARDFIDRTRKGIHQALSLPGTALIVAHGGVHWALCALLGITNHEWKLHNCGLVHFSVGKQEEWIASRLA